MRQNRLHHALALCLIVILLLSLLSFVPEFTIGKWRLKKIDLLAAIREVPKTGPEPSIAEKKTQTIRSTKADSVIQMVQSKAAPDITYIEDYSAGHSGLAYFKKAISDLKKNKKPLRIAVYGDSFIEGDVFCGSLRDTLQTLYGGRGVGYVPITSEVAGFRNTIKHAFENWKTYSLVSKKDSTVSIDLGPAGYTFLPEEDNRVEYKTSKQRYLREFSTLKLYYKNSGEARLTYTINDTTTVKTALRKSSSLQEWAYAGNGIKRVQFEFDNSDGIQLYGASFENDEGVLVDNFSMRGNSGLSLSAIDEKMFKEFNHYRNYKLIVLQYGLNVTREDVANYNWYVSRMVTVVEKIKRAFPQTSILLISVSDRSENDNGAFKTMKDIPAIRDAQRTIAQKTGIAFWDLYEAMGGENSMVKFVEAKPALAAKDYTHLTFKGGKKLAQLLVKSLLHEPEQHDKKAVLQ